MSRLARTERRGFTLIELMVVVAIIVALIAILLPSLGKASAVAQSAVCLSQQKQIVMGLFYYADDNGGWLLKPFDLDRYQDTTMTGSSRWGIWGGRLFALDYIGENNQILACSSIDKPIAELPGWDETQEQNVGDNGTMRYIYGLRMGEPLNAGIYNANNLRKIVGPSSFFLTTESTYVDAAAANFPEYLGRYYAIDLWHSVYLAHQQQAAASFADGSARLAEPLYFRDRVAWGTRVLPMFYDPIQWGVFDLP